MINNDIRESKEVLQYSPMLYPPVLKERAACPEAMGVAMDASPAILAAQIRMRGSMPTCIPIATPRAWKIFAVAVSLMN